MASDGNGEGGPDEKATIVAGPSFDELLAKRAEAAGTGPTDQPPSWSQDMAFAATAMGQSYDELLAEKGLPLPSDVPPPAAGSPPPGHPAPAFPVPAIPAASTTPGFPASAPSQPALPQPFGTAPTAPPPGAPPPAAQPPGLAPSPFGPPAGTPQYGAPHGAAPHGAAPHTPAPQHTPAPVPAPVGQGGKPPLAATMALDMSQNPLFAPHLDPNAPANSYGAPPSSPMVPAYGMAPVPTATAPAPKSKLLLFAVTFAAVFVVGSICFGGMAIFLLM